MSNKTFKHNLTSNDLDEIGGYTKCLTALMHYIADKTEFNPDKRYIDSVELLETIDSTNKELEQLIKQAYKNLLRKV